MSKKVSKCPECKGEIQATLKISLSNIVLGSGEVKSFSVDSASFSISDDTYSAIDELIQIAEGDELTLYCQNDHRIDLDGRVVADDDEEDS